MVDDFIPFEIGVYYGLNSKTSKAKLPVGFSSSSDLFHDVDLSTPGIAKTRGGTDTKLNIGYVIKRIAEWFIPFIDAHYIVLSGGTKVSIVDQSYATLNEDTGFTADNQFDFLNYGDELFYCNGADAGRIASIISGSPAFRKWGIDGPGTNAPGYAADSGTGLTGTYSYRYTYVNSTSGHESNASDQSADHTVANKTININGLVASADPQVDKINIYRTTNGGATYFFLVQIDNGTTTYADSIADTALGSTEAPYFNDPPDDFLGIEEFDGRIFGFEPNSTILKFSNDEFYTLTGNPEESFHPDNFINLRAKIFGIKKSPNFNELWVHTAKGVYGVIPTGIAADPYRAAIRNSSVNAGVHYCIVNIYNQQWFLTQDFRVISIDSSGNVDYESYLIEPDMNGANKTKIANCQAAHYRGVNKNQYRLILPIGGATTPNRVLSANYLQRTPPDDLGLTRPVWEYHTNSSQAIGVVKNSSGNDVLYYSDLSDNLLEADTGTNDDGAAISWSFELGWWRATKSLTKPIMPRKILPYFNPLGNWSFSFQTNFDFGLSGGQVYAISMNPVGDKWDIDFVWDISVWAAATSLLKIPQSIFGVFNHAQFIWYGSVLDQPFEMHTVEMQLRAIEGNRDVNN